MNKYFVNSSKNCENLCLVTLLCNDLMVHRYGVHDTRRKWSMIHLLLVFRGYGLSSLALTATPDQITNMIGHLRPVESFTEQLKSKVFSKVSMLIMVVKEQNWKTCMVQYQLLTYGIMGSRCYMLEQQTISHGQLTTNLIQRLHNATIFLHIFILDRTIIHHMVDNKLDIYIRCLDLLPIQDLVKSYH